MSVKPLSYDEKLTLEEAKERLEELQEEFDSLKTKYTKGLRKIQFWLPKKDRKRITDCIGVILPLSLQEAVQKELYSAPGSEETTHYKANVLQHKLLDMLASFKNTKTKRFGYSEPIWKDDDYMMTDYASRHNADGGLQLLRYLGLDVTEQEEAAFVILWDTIYERNEEHFLTTACKLYGILPFAVAKSDIDEDVRRQREKVYTGKINSVKLEPWMRE